MEDIDAHLPYLRDLASHCDSIVEFGVREGQGSTVAFAEGVNKRLTSYDVVPLVGLVHLDEISNARGIELNLVQGDSLQVEIPECDFLFIDSKHTYEQLSGELARHHEKVKQYLGFHDTVTFGHRGEDGSVPGLVQAVADFQTQHPEWETFYHTPICNGLTILKKRHAEG